MNSINLHTIATPACWMPAGPVASPKHPQGNYTTPTICFLLLLN